MTESPPPSARSADDQAAALDRANARIVELSRELSLLRTPTEPPVPGKKVVGVLFLLIGLALATAFGIWAAARKPWAEKKLPLPPPAAPIVDESGRAIVLALQKCVSAIPESEPISIKLRVKIGQDGSTAVVEANVQPASEALVPCTRQSASELRPPKNDRDYDLLILYEATSEPKYRRMARWSWSVVEMNNSRLRPGLRRTDSGRTTETQRTQRASALLPAGERQDARLGVEDVRRTGSSGGYPPRKDGEVSGCTRRAAVSVSSASLWFGPRPCPQAP